MNKQIKQIRQSIRERKKQRHFERQVKQPIVRHETITDEERHGFYNETFHQEAPTKKGEEIRIFSSSLGLQFFGALLFIGFCAFIFQTELRTLEKPKQLLEEALTEHFPFAAVHDWYVQTLGAPLSLVPQETAPTLSDQSFIVPVVGEVVESFNVNGTGIQIMPPRESEVRAVDKGIVIFAGNTKETERTVMIQHADRSVTTYGKLSNVHVHLFQTVHANEVIGRIDPKETEETLFFSIEQKNGYIDPVKVINVDGKQTH